MSINNLIGYGMLALALLISITMRLSRISDQLDRIEKHLMPPEEAEKPRIIL